jgi:hypothetical protein
VQSGLGLASLAKKLVPFGTGRQFIGLYSQTFDFLIETFWESQDIPVPTTLHDTTSCLRVLTVGFASSDHNMPTIGRQFQSGHNSN